MVHQLLSFARQQVIVPKILAIDEAIANLLPLLRRLVNDNIQFEWHLDSKHVRIHIDPSQFDQIIANLFVNARDAISGKGTITVGSETIHIKQNDRNTGNTFLKPGDYVRLSVTDTGCGIDKKHLSHIFEPFFTAKKAGKGTGLELSIVYAIVKQNGGHIDCKTNPGKSTTFNIYLPRYLEFDEHKESEPSEHGPEHPGKETILLVEDEPDIRFLIHKTLEIEGYNVLVAPRAEEAVRIALRHKHQLVLLVTDIVLPRMNGVQLYDTLQDLKPGLKVLFMSDNASDEIIGHQRTLQDGVGFINKPFSIRNFIQTFYTVLHPRST
jgi:two-component system cell cycle sensor histidine kinase/response regulator CckA